MLKNTVVIIGIILLCASCATKPVPAPGPDPALIALQHSAAAIEKDLRNLILIEKRGYKTGLRAVLPKNGPIAKRIDLDWNGPLEPVIRRVAVEAGLQFAVMGEPPAVPVTVKLHHTNAPVYLILDNAAWQATPKAEVLVDPIKRLITVAYLPETSVYGNIE